MTLSRRTLLATGLGGAALLAVGGLGLALRPTVLIPHGALVVLTPEEYAIVAAAAEAVHPGVGGAPSAADLRVAERVDAVLPTLHPADVVDLRRLFALLESAAAGLLIDGRLSTFTASTLERRQEILRTWRDHRSHTIRRAFGALQGLISASYWGQAATWAHCGYPGPPDLSAVPSPGDRGIPR